MKNLNGKFAVGQELFYRVGKIHLPVTFVSYGPRIGNAAGKDAVTSNPQTSIVKDGSGNLFTVFLAELERVPS